jgi:acetylornithine deacetylase/succinyl-diaminopimelate desuccinylase-like protein
MPDKDRVSSLMPELTAELVRSVAIPSRSAPGFPADTHGPLLEAYEHLAALFADAGVEDVAALELPGTAPVLTGQIPAPDGAPTVLLYSHYDIVGPGDEALWSSPPFTATARDGALYGRGTADSKANVIAHVGALRAWDGRPPVGIKLVIEGQEEVGGGALLGHPADDPDPYRRAARHGDGHGRGQDARGRQAQRPVRRRRA